MMKLPSYDEYVKEYNKNAIQIEDEKEDSSDSIDFNPPQDLAKDLYLDYITWLIKSRNLQKVNATDLLFQLKIINDYVLKLSMAIVQKLSAPKKNADEKEMARKTNQDIKQNEKEMARKTNEDIQQRVHTHLVSRTEIMNGYLDEMGGKPKKVIDNSRLPMLFLAGVTCAIALIVVFTFAVEISPWLALSAIVGAVFTPALLYTGFGLLKHAAKSLSFAVQRPFDHKLNSPEQAEFNLDLSKSLFHNSDLAPDSIVNKLVTQTTLTMYETIYPNKERSQKVNALYDHEVDLDRLKSKITTMSQG